MRILVDFQDSSGGAPRSLKEHALLLKENGHEIIAVMAEKKYGNFFDNTGFEVIHIPRFYTKYLLKNFILIRKYYTLIKQKEIDLIYTNRVSQCQFLSIVSDFCGVPILNARAGGFGISDIVRIQKDKHYIVYSEENLQTFKHLGFPDKQLFLVRNRIPIPVIHNHVNTIPEKEFIITVTGSIKEETIKGLLWFFKFIEQTSIQSNIQYQVYLAGGNIIKSEKAKNEFKNAFAKTQQTLPENWQITHLGWVDNITELQARSHICIGKGRSVIQPAMIGKIAFVISETGTLYRCKKETYNDLLFYNFSGRGKIKEKTDSLKEFKELLTNNYRFIAYQEEANELTQKFKEDYATGYVKEKLEEIVHKVENNQIRHNNPFKSGFIKYFRNYFEYFKSKL